MIKQPWGQIHAFGCLQKNWCIALAKRKTQPCSLLFSALLQQFIVIVCLFCLPPVESKLPLFLLFLMIIKYLISPISRNLHTQLVNTWPQGTWVTLRFCRSWEKAYEVLNGAPKEPKMAIRSLRRCGNQCPVSFITRWDSIYCTESIHPAPWPLR